MKRFVILLTILTLLLCGCGRDHDPAASVDPTEITEPPVTEATTPAETTGDEVSETTPVVYEQQPMVAVSMPLRTEYVTEGDSTVYYYTYQDIYINVQDQQVADRIIVDYLNRRDRFHTISQAFAQDAKDSYTGSEYWNPFFFESVYSPVRLDSGVLSLFGQNAFYSGGNHPELECMAANYSMITGEVLTLGSILSDESRIDSLCALVTEQMAALQNDYALFSDYADTVAQRFTREASYDEDWFFSASGLCFFFAPYEVAPYTSGIITVEVPYNKLVGIISDEFFPAETDGATGVLSAERLVDADIEDFTQIAEVPLSEIGEQVFLSCDGLLRNVRLDYGSWNESGTVFTAKTTVFATYTLSPGDGIVVTTDIPDTMPTIRITCDSGNEQFVSYISQSGKDGSILLLSDLPVS